MGAGSGWESRWGLGFDTDSEPNLHVGFGVSVEVGDCVGVIAGVGVGVKVRIEARIRVGVR